MAMGPTGKLEPNGAAGVRFSGSEGLHESLRYVVAAPELEQTFIPHLFSCSRFLAGEHGSWYVLGSIR